jgi:hypothetical protein
MSRWSKRSEEEKLIILKEQNPVRQSRHAVYQQMRNDCMDAKIRAGHAKEKHCSACDLRCPGCPFESAWPKVIK